MNKLERFVKYLNSEGYTVIKQDTQEVPFMEEIQQLIKKFNKKRRD